MDISKYVEFKEFSKRSGLPVTFLEKMVSQGKLTSITVGRKKLLDSAQVESLTPDLINSVQVVTKSPSTPEAATKAMGGGA